MDEVWFDEWSALVASTGLEPEVTFEGLLNRPGWHERAACRGGEVEAFFPARGGDGGEAARRVCQVCPVRVECLEFAMADPTLIGVWGGTSGRERRQLRRGRAA